MSLLLVFKEKLSWLDIKLVVVEFVVCMLFFVFVVLEENVIVFIYFVLF